MRHPNRSLLSALTLVLWASACADDGSGTIDAGEDAGNTDLGGEDVAADIGIDAERETGWFDGTYRDGGDPEGPVENCTDGVDNNRDTQVDCNDPQCAGRLVCTAVARTELEPNDSAETGQSLALPLSVRGTIDTFTVDEDGDSVEDRDWYLFTIDEPTVVRWVLDDANGLALLRGTIVGLDDENDDVVRRLDIDTPGLARQAYLARPGRYGVEVRDTRNTTASGEERPYGGDNYDYAMLIEALNITPESGTVPIDSGPSDLGPQNAVRLIDIELTGGEVLEAEVFAQRLTPSSGLDAILYLVDRDDASVLATSDDAPISTVDPLLRTGIVAEDRTARLILDAFSFARESRYELFVDSLRPSQDLEPNSPIALAFPLSPGVDVEGNIGAPELRFRSTIRDFDYFIIEGGGRSASYLIDLEAVGVELDASVRTGFRSRSGSNLVFSEVIVADPPIRRDVRLEAVSLFDADLIIEVTDRRHIFVEDESVGGDEGFEYTLSVTPNVRDFATIELPYSAEEAWLQHGNMEWFELTAPARTRLVARARETAEEGVEPWLYLTAENDAYLRRGRRGLDYLVPAETTYRLGAIDRRAGGGVGYAYDLEVFAEEHTLVDDTEPNDGPPEGGQTLEGEGPWWIDGVVSGEGPDDFDVDSYLIVADVGMRITAETTAGADGESNDADTILTLSGPGLDEPVVNDNDGIGNNARILDFEVPARGMFVVAVSPFCNDDGCRGGDYGLSLRVFTP